MHDVRDARADERRHDTLRWLIAIRSDELGPALDEAMGVLSRALRADKADVLLFDPASDSLVAVGTSDTPMGRLQRDRDLDRQPLVEDGPAVGVFLHGHSYRTGHADQDPTQAPGNVKALGVRSEMDCPLEVDGERRGVLLVSSAEPDRFGEGDLRFLQEVAGWIGALAGRIERGERRVREARARGRREAAEEMTRLTPRQREVAALIADGLSNAQIAERLTLVEGTVANHMEAILRRLGFRSRTQVAVWAAERGLHGGREG